MSRNTDANKKIHNKKIADKKRKIQEAELKRKNRLKEMRENTKAKLTTEQEDESQAS
ncbi:hypothetical protein [Chryseobacterium wangxinyae]|uniref:hypothetical protein n=1 Tax=unclassified Chryseobacterium TaxID=2593645 RepID=UPI00226F2964|nr:MULTISPECIES: hypothetical protein [unclassified Chryseobacterium]MCY0971077.1 hypothetical protein [Chryseobacterium sp. CY353]MCY0977742.1 hypothetical protein [Chryseobacterium sp. CY350]WBZ94831.1 hypothetical protein PGH12_15360 [Chryseobacterium sp. CY350]